MRAVRRRLSALLISWLFFQCVAIAAPLVLAAANVTVAGHQRCDCPGTEHGATCPMHHEASLPSSTLCAFTAAHDATDVALLTFAGGIGVLHALPSIDIGPSAFALVHLRVDAFQTRTQLPASPPPRV